MALLSSPNHPDDGQLAALINRTGKVVVADKDVPVPQAPKLFCDNERGGYLARQQTAGNGHQLSEEQGL